MFQHDCLDTCRFECLICMFFLCFFFCICPCSAQLRMLHMERRSGNTLIIIIIVNILYVVCVFKRLFKISHYGIMKCILSFLNETCRLF